MAMSKAQLEKRYGVKIYMDGNPYFKRGYEYAVFTLDGCKWANGLPTLAVVEKMCKNDSVALLDIKRNNENLKNLKKGN